MEKTEESYVNDFSFNEKINYEHYRIIIVITGSDFMKLLRDTIHSRDLKAPTFPRTASVLH